MYISSVSYIHKVYYTFYMQHKAIPHHSVCSRQAKMLGAHGLYYPSQHIPIKAMKE